MMIPVKVADLLPHDGDMVLLDKVLSYDSESLQAELIVRDHLLANQGVVPAWLGIEYMAQTIAAHGGINCYLANRPINLGFLLGTRHYDSNVASISVGTKLTVKVRRVIEDQGLAVFDCQVYGEGVQLTAKLNVYQPDTANNRAILD